MTLPEAIAATCAGFLFRDLVRVLFLSICGEVKEWDNRDPGVSLVRRIARRATWFF